MSAEFEIVIMSISVFFFGVND